MTHTLVVIQHCQSEHHVRDLVGGWTDTPLTELGRRQAELLAAYVARGWGGKATRLFHSDLLRAAQTAASVAATLGLTAMAAPALREFNNGDAAWKTRAAASALRDAMPPQPAGIDRQPYPNAETWRRFYARVRTFLDSHCADATAEPTVLVAHGGTVRLIIHWWLRLDVESVADVQIKSRPGGVTTLTTGENGERILDRLSDTSYLAALEGG